MNERASQTGFLISDSWLKPTKRRLAFAFLFSLAVHAASYPVLKYAPVVTLALNFTQLEFVDEDYDRAILIDLSKPLRYPGDYPGFGVPEKVKDLEAIKKEEEARRKRLEAERRRRQAEAERELGEREAEAKRETEERTLAEQQAQAAPTPTPTPKPASFGRINTAPIRDQIQRLYDAKKAGKLVLPDGRLRVGVAGQIEPDGSIKGYRVIVSSGQPDIDRAALAILAAVSESKALGPLHQLTSLSMILDVDQIAKLTVTGFAPDAQTAASLQAMAKLALSLARTSKAGDPAAMVILNNIKVIQNDKRIQADVIVPRQTATDTLARTMGGASPQQ
jgi:hypothetical protein